MAYYGILMKDGTELAHYGVKGMKWGKRLFGKVKGIFGKGKESKLSVTGNVGAQVNLVKDAVNASSGGIVDDIKALDRWSKEAAGLSVGAYKQGDYNAASELAKKSNEYSKERDAWIDAYKTGKINTEGWRKVSGPDYEENDKAINAGKKLVETLLKNYKWK